MRDFLIHLFSAWNTDDVHYLLLRNYETLPEHVDNDLDILIDKRDFKKALLLLYSVANSSGFLVHNHCPFACDAIYLCHQQSRRQVHLDLMSEVRWHLFPIIDSGDFLATRRSFKSFYIPAESREATASLCTHLVYRGRVKEKYKEVVLRTAVRDFDALEGCLKKNLGSLGRPVAQFAKEGDWDALERCCGRIRRRLISRELFQYTGRFCTGVVSTTLRVVRRWRHSPGICIVFFGPDGCGKTSVAQELKQGLSTTFPVDQNVHLHWKPSIFKWWKGKGGDLNFQNPDPHMKAPRGRAASLLFFAIHVFEYVLGWWIRVHPALFKNRLVMIDRYYYDFYVDMRRYRLNLPIWMLDLAFFFIRKPDMVFCLDADPEILQSRKKEVSFDECTRQRNAYRDLTEKLPNGYVIDASQPLRAVARDIEAQVLVYMTERLSRRKVG